MSMNRFAQEIGLLSQPVPDPELRRCHRIQPSLERTGLN